MKRKSFRASRGKGGGGGGGTEFRRGFKSRERYNESCSFSNDLMKGKSFRASHERGGGGGNLNSDEDKSRELSKES